ncbi:MAG: AI-2E family transporter [Armatimonadetes bacterium]|nr:AI-2E family transporter [Armatimonadota bacterium]NIM23148.1 AI-2E family transporter [Armatimonadota bacterium]NIM67016.1 AI-2E family transporter [Armatimonadota bacterium]NIM75550.1 AI-2E family transporter [Armatimonadota bacterium]NIN05205.1 AI-2E family transporter [Armatimonadota bacterium]
MSEIFSLPRESWLRYLVQIALAVVLVYIVWQVRLVLIILLLGMLLAYALRPLVIAFEKARIGGWKLPRGLAVALAFAVLIGFLWIFTVSLVPPLGQEIAELKTKFPEQRERFSNVWSSARDFYEQHLPESVREAFDVSFAEMRTRLTDFSSKVLSGTFRGIGFVAELFLVPILAFYFLADAEALRRQMLFFVPRHLRPGFARSMEGLSDIMYRYVVAQLILCFVAFAVVSTALWALKIKFWLALGLFAGITRAVPVIGPLLGGIPVVAAALAQTQSIGFGLWVTVFFTFLHLFESKYLMPAVLGRQLGLHPVLIIFALLVGAEFLGLIGMFIAVPILAAIQFLISEYRSHTSAEPA